MSPPNPAPSSPIEDLREYVDAFRASSNRSRYSLYVVIVTSVLIGIATLNAHAPGWPLRRIKTWYGNPLSSQVHVWGDTAAIKIAREEYVRQFVSRGVMPASPIPGVSMDVNDLGLIGGIALILLTLVMLFCLLREHENLQLAMYKVRQLCVEDGARHSRGDSRANLLYHALAMGQVLASPPTLARWQKRLILRYFGVIYLAPAAVQFWVWWNNRQTIDVGASYKANVKLSLTIQLIIFVLILIASLSSMLTSSAMAQRWDSAFYRVNPARRVAPHIRWWQWMKFPRLPKYLRRPRSPHDQIRPRLITSLVDGLTIADARVQERVSVQCRVPIRKERIREADVRRIVDNLFKAGVESATEWCRDHQTVFNELVSFTPEQSRYVPLRNADAKAEWHVSGKWSFYYVPRQDDAPVPPADEAHAPAAMGTEPPPPAAPSGEIKLSTPES